MLSSASLQRLEDCLVPFITWAYLSFTPYGGSRARKKHSRTTIISDLVHLAVDRPTTGQVRLLIVSRVQTIAWYPTLSGYRSSRHTKESFAIRIQSHPYQNVAPETFCQVHIHRLDHKTAAFVTSDKIPRENIR